MTNEKWRETAQLSHPTEEDFLQKLTVLLLIKGSWVC